MLAKRSAFSIKSFSLIMTSIFASLLLSGCDGNTWCNITERVGLTSKSCAKNAQNQDGNPGPEVGVFTLKAQPFTITSQLPGRVSAYRTAEVRPQVNGVILKRFFEEGTNIEAGVSLYQIDPAPFEAALKSAESNLVSAKAGAEIASITVNRLQTLLGTSAVSRQDFDSALANKRQADAAVSAAQGAFENAKINLTYTQVLSPIAGRIGRSNVTEGALVGTGQTLPLTTIHQLDNVYIDIPQSSREYQALRNKIDLGKITNDGKAKVTLQLENGQTYSHVGEIAFSDISVDPTTGAVTLRAIFSNPELTLLPGMFVQTIIDEGVQENAILVPQQAVNRTPTGDASVIVVNKQNMIEQRVVKTELAVGNMWLVSDGVAVGDRVLVSGIARLRYLSKDQPFVNPIEENLNEQKQEAPSAHQAPNDNQKSDDDAKSNTPNGKTS